MDPNSPDSSFNEVIHSKIHFMDYLSVLEIKSSQNAKSQVHLAEMQPLQAAVSGLWREEWSTEAVRWVTVTWELLLLTAHFRLPLEQSEPRKSIPDRSHHPPDTKHWKTRNLQSLSGCDVLWVPRDSKKQALWKLLLMHRENDRSIWTPTVIKETKHNAYGKSPLTGISRLCVHIFVPLCVCEYKGV